MEVLMNYVKPELVILAVALYLIGLGLKKTELIKDKFIPAALGLIGVALAALYVLATSHFGGASDILMAIFTSIIQGILCAGLSTYVNQMVKQLGKNE
nr:MAG TPA: holin [Caudoviricetes sp.]